MDQRIINLFDEYTHKPLKREEFVRRLAKITGSTAAALSVLPLLEVNYVQAATVAENDEEIITEDIHYDSAGVSMKAYLARPKAEKKYGGVMVIHENRGLNAHIKDVARRVAKSGFLAMAPDALSPFGGTPEDEDKARELIGQLEEVKNRENFLQGFKFLKGRIDCNDKTGCVGFCWGGAMSNQMALHYPSLNAAVSFYGRQPASEEVKSIRAKVQLHYGGLDERINAGIPAYEEALKKAGIDYELFVYEGAQHAFHNDTAPTRYSEAAAKLAWDRTMELFNNTLK